jgi:hypothetical protein
MSDVRDRYTHVKDYVKVTLIEVHTTRMRLHRSCIRTVNPFYLN